MDFVNLVKGIITSITTTLRDIIRNPFSLEKIRYIAETGAIIYTSGMSHGRNNKKIEIFGVEEFIATISQYITDKSFQRVRYCGWDSISSGGDRREGDFRCRQRQPPESKFLSLNFANRPELEFSWGYPAVWLFLPSSVVWVLVKFKRGK